MVSASTNPSSCLECRFGVQLWSSRVGGHEVKNCITDDGTEQRAVPPGDGGLDTYIAAASSSNLAKNDSP